MSAGLTIVAEWESLNEGSSEEKAAFGLLEIAANSGLLAEGQDEFVKRLRPGPFVSNYHCAEWFAWNWWRLRWEGRSNASEWPLAHKMSTIGAGYVWPNLTIYSDGERIVLISKPSSEGKETSFRYIKDIAVFVRAIEFEGAVDGYIEQVISQLRAETIGATNLDRIWADLQEERRNPALSQRRCFEALMGRDPGEANEEQITGLIHDARDLGEGAARELAAHAAKTTRQLQRAIDLRNVASACGFDFNPNDAVRLPPEAALPAVGLAPAWKRGAAAAVALRKQENLGMGPISDDRLEEMAGVARGAIERRERRNDELSFALADARQSSVAFRAKWKTGRRFELARLLGDGVAAPDDGRLRPATNAHTYRQKLQRSFGAEFLCPFESVSQMLAGDFSAEAIEDVGHHFSVSEYTVRTLLANHGCIDRDQIAGEFGYEATA